MKLFKVFHFSFWKALSQVKFIGGYFGHMENGMICSLDLPYLVSRTTISFSKKVFLRISCFFNILLIFRLLLFDWSSFILL
jgi:hypothetical protein